MERPKPSIKLSHWQILSLKATFFHCCPKPTENTLMSQPVALADTFYRYSEHERCSFLSDSPAAANAPQQKHWRFLIGDAQRTATTCPGEGHMTDGLAGLAS